MAVTVSAAAPAGADDLLVEFGAGGTGAQVVGTGWYAPEQHETWSAGRESRLSLPAAVQAGDHVLVLKMRPLVSERHPRQRVTLHIGDTEIGHFTIDRRAVRACVIPWHLIAGRRVLDIRLSLPDAARPADIGLNDDRRTIAVALASLLLYRDGHDAGANEASRHEPVPVDMASIAAADRMPLPDLMLRFESLGQNCEFGLVQRQCQAEPLGLLRFSSTKLPNLLAALEARFAGLGAAQTTTVQLSANGREFMVRDTRYGFEHHAWVDAGEMSADEVMRRELRRVPFLVRKLIEDLEAGDKILVFKGMGAMAQEEVFPLAMAVRRYGPNTLLLVTLADAAHRGGTVEARAPGLLVGHIDRFAPGDNAHDLLLGQWVRICREAYRLRLAAGSRRT